jgi:MFS transporter, ACS family, hexuronate transporter
MENNKSSTSYQWILIAILSANFGVVFFDRNAMGILTPFIQPDLKLTNTQIGFISAGFSFAWAIAGLFMGGLSDRFGRRKMILVITTLVFALASVLSGLATTFVMLVAARMLMGVAEGGIMPIAQTLIASEVAPERRGLAHGITQNFGANLLANWLGPIVITAIAIKMGWHKAFYLVAIPGFLMTLLIALFVRDPVHLSKEEKPAPGAVGRLLSDRTILTCVAISILLVAFLVVYYAFTGLYLNQVKGISAESAGNIMSYFGLASILIAFIVPGLSDRLGRKPVAFVAATLGALMPLGLLFFQGNSILPYCLSVAAGASISGVFPLAMATIPSEVVPKGLTATALSMTMGLSEVIGGVFAPTLAGMLADKHGLSAPMWVMLASALGAGVLALTLRETAPLVLARRAKA